MDIQLSHKDLHTFYTEYFFYYTTLNSDWQKKFVERVHHFIDSKSISGADGFIINNKVRAIVAASAVQLTLGLETWDYDYFMEIIIHPRIFTNKTTNEQYKGETNLQGYIRLSWLSFIQGYKDQHDNINLGIHEFTHALRFNGIRGNSEDYYVKYFFIKWLSTACEAHYHIKAGKETIFRSYGGANLSEFTSVCFEHYFESPEQIKASYPHLFYNTAILLNQHTSDEQTQIDIREQMMIEKNEIMIPILQREIKQSIRTDSSIPLIIVTLFILITTAAKIGLINGPCLILLVVAVLFYFRLERNYLTVQINNKELEIKKGFFICKNWHKRKILLSQLVNLQCYENGKQTDLVFIYYNFKDKHFYEESLECDTAHVKELLEELKANKIAINRI